MTIQPGAVLNTLAFGNRPEGVEVPVIATRAPSTYDWNYPLGKRWVDKTNNATYELTSITQSSGVNTATWITGGGASIAIETINGNAPISNDYTLAGTASQIDVTETAGTSTLSFPNSVTFPGDVLATTTLEATLGITAGTTITATLGDITATDGNFVKGTAGNKDVYTSVASNATAGANSAGTVTLVGGTATISTTSVTASSLIRIYRQGIGATGAAALGILTIGTITAATSFVINSVQAADATALQASDVSVVFWEIVN